MGTKNRKFYFILGAILVLMSQVQASSVFSDKAYASTRELTQKLNKECPWNKRSGYVNSVVISPDGKTLYSGGEDGIIRIWDVYSGKLRGKLTANHKGEVSSLAITRDGKTLVSGNGVQDVIVGEPTSIKVWDTDTLKLKKTLIGHSRNIFSMAIFPDDKTLISLSNDERIWNIETGELIEILDKDINTLLAISKDGKMLVGKASLTDRGTDTRLKLWEVPDLKLIGEMIKVGRVDSLAFTPDRKNLIISSDRIITGWNVETEEVQSIFIDNNIRSSDPYAHTQRVSSLIVTPDGNTFISASYDGYIKFWDIKNEKLIKTLGRPLVGGIKSLALTSDGKILASASRDSVVELWDVNTSKLLKFLCHSSK